MSKYDQNLKLLKCKTPGCERMVKVDQSTGSVTCWFCCTTNVGAVCQTPDKPDPDCSTSK
jgi:hypothetical protein